MFHVSHTDIIYYGRINLEVRKTTPQTMI